MPDPQSPDFDAQRLYDGVALVARAGARSQRQLCVMSLVALMAGERHSDRPDCACPVVTAYAIKLNDALDDDTRQRLKPFAPRIIGTRDGYGAERARFLVGCILRDVAPRLIGKGSDTSAALVAALRLTADETPRMAARRLATVLRGAVRAGAMPHGRSGDLRYLLRAYGRESHELVATASAVLLANCARLTDDPRMTQWFWNYATDLLDRACDVGISGVRSTADVERMSQQAAARLQLAALRSRRGGRRRGGLAAFFGTPAG